MAKLWEYLVPHYGNYGGPGYSGGAMMDNYDEVDWSVEPTDSLDQCFHDHDRNYQAHIKDFDEGKITNKEKLQLWTEADKILIKEMDELSPNPKKWPETPTKNSNKYAWFYRKVSIGIFWIKVKLCTWRNGEYKPQSSSEESNT